MAVLAHAAKQFETSVFHSLPRELWFQIAAAVIAVAPGALALHFAGGPLLAQLFICGVAYAVAYLAALRVMGQLPPVREWIPRRAAVQVA